MHYPLSSTSGSLLPQTQLLTANQNSEELPVEIWDLILNFATQGCSLRQLVSYSLVCQDFKDLCIKHFRESLFYFARNAHPVYLPTSVLFHEGHNIRLIDDEHRLIFYIINTFTLQIISKDGSLPTQKIDLRQTFKGLAEIPAKSEKEWEGGLFVYKCFSTSTGIVLISRALISFWEFNSEGSIELRKWHCPYAQHEDLNKFIKAYLVQQNKLVFFIGQSDVGYILELENDYSLLCLEGNIDKPTLKKIFDYKGKIYRHLLSDSNGISVSAADIEWKLTEGGLDGKLKVGETLFQGSHDFPARAKKIFGQYAVFYCAQGYFVFCMERDAVIYEERFPSSELKAFHNYQFFIQNDIFFLFDNEFKAIYLPTQKNVTDLFTPFLKPYLSQNYSISSLKIIDSADGFYLYLILLQPTDKYFSVKIPFYDNKLEPPEVEPLPNMPEESQAAEPKPTPNKSHLFKSGGCCSTPKIVTLVGSIFLLLTVFSTTVQFIFPTGMVLFHASGITLTLPTLLSGMGGAASLVVIAVGSVLWCRASKQK